MVKTKKEKGAKAPTEKQIAYAKSLGIENPEQYSRKQLAKIIEQKVIKKTLPERETNHQVEEAETEVVAVVEEAEEEAIVEEYPGYTGIQKPIRVCISIQRNRDTFALLKKKKMYQNFPSLFEELMLFLKRVGVKKQGNTLIVISDDDEGVLSPSYVRSVLDSFFIQYTWEYV